MTKKTLIAASALVAVALAGILGCNLKAHATSADAASHSAPSPAQEGTGGGREVGPMPSLAPLVKKIRPSVVNIFTTQNVRPHPMNPFGGGEQGGMEDFFRHFFGGQMPDQQQTMKRQALGSGFIIGEGLVLTNNHVIDGADDIKVKTADGREFHAKVKGADKSLDVALLQLDGDGARATKGLILGDSDQTEVGDYVVAIGNPFGLSLTVTAGIISAKERVIGEGPYDDFIQTDASINPGNSGGPLFNLRGEVIGINTAIVAQGQGIGFAVPINMAKDVLPQLRDKGKVTRGYLGAQIEEITPDLATALNLDYGKGALVSHVVKKGPGARAGLRDGDVILACNEHPTDSQGALTRAIAAIPPGRSANLRVLRDGKALDIAVKVGERPSEDSLAQGDGSGNEGEGGGDSESTASSSTIGLTVTPLTANIAERLGIPPGEGLLVTGVADGSAADAAGVLQNDVLLELQHHAVNSAASYDRVAGNVKGGDMVLFRVRRGGSALFLAAPAPRK